MFNAATTAPKRQVSFSDITDASASSAIDNARASSSTESARSNNDTQVAVQAMRAARQSTGTASALKTRFAPASATQRRDCTVI